MRVEIGEIEIIAERTTEETRPSSAHNGQSLEIENLRRELAQLVETLVREEFRRRMEK